MNISLPPLLEMLLDDNWQGSRLTAFELVHEKIPATLIADSAAAALMKDGRVDGVIVGADRVASNGALKIIWFSLHKSENQLI